MTDGHADHDGQGRSGLTVRSILLATLFSIAGGWWIKQSELVGFAVQLGESVPVIPAVAVLVFFILANPLLGRIHPKLALRRSEIGVIFVVLSITPVLNSIGMFRMMLPMMICAKFYATPENHLDLIWDRLPHWFGPRSERLITDAFRGHAPGVPWLEWLPGLTVWFVFSGALYLALLALNAIFRKQWTERERLSFPLMQMVEELSPTQSRGIVTLLKDHYFWVGASIPLLYSLLSMTHAFFPTFPKPGYTWDLGAGLEARPWNALKPLSVTWRPELVGLGYLMSTEVTFSIWASYFALRASRLVSTVMGFTDPYSPFPYDQSQAMGCFLALALVSAWLGRDALREVFVNTFSRRQFDDSAEPMAYRMASLTLVGGLGVVLWISVKAGMGWSLAALYFTFVVAVALVYTRVRAETGAPMVWLFPFWQQERLIYSMFGSANLMAGSGQGLVILGSFTWISRGYFPNAVMSTQLESYKLADMNGMSRKQMTWVLIYAFIIGFIIAAWAHLSTYYDVGCEYAEFGGRAKLQNQGYLNVAQILTGQVRKPNYGEAGAGLFGFLFSIATVALRVRLVGFPFHPLGYAMATAYGHPLWGPALLVWSLKTFILKVGGIRLFRRLIPLFLGLIVGHYFAAGVVWGAVAIWYPDVTRNFVVYFG